MVWRRTIINEERPFEWTDDILTSSEKKLIYALANAKNIKDARMKFIGSRRSSVEFISKKDVESLKRTLELYHALGGSY